MRDFERRVRDQLRTTDGDAARDADAVQDKTHGDAECVNSGDIARENRDL